VVFGFCDHWNTNTKSSISLNLSDTHRILQDHRLNSTSGIVKTRKS
jgi:hypothetical protein